MQLEEVKLKKKVNSLIERNDELQNLLSEKDSHIMLLQEEIKMMKIRENSSGAQEDRFFEEESEIFSFVKDFYVIAKLIIENDDYISYRYETKNSEYYYKIEKNTFDDYVCKYARCDLKTFLNFCVDLALVKSEKNRKCVYPSADIQVYYVSRPFMNAAIKYDEGSEREA